MNIQISLLGLGFSKCLVRSSKIQLVSSFHTYLDISLVTRSILSFVCHCLNWILHQGLNSLKFLRSWILAHIDAACSIHILLPMLHTILFIEVFVVVYLNYTDSILMLNTDTVQKYYITHHFVRDEPNFEKSILKAGCIAF